jgi:hypothetical protein
LFEVNKPSEYTQRGRHAAASEASSMGIDLPDNYRRAADLVLKGTKPSELGLDVPWLLQQRADEVIEESGIPHRALCHEGNRPFHE